MKNLPLLFCGIFATLAFSWLGIVLTGHIQYGALEPTTAELDPDTGAPVEGEPFHPPISPGLARQGRQVYIQMGCLYCHTQQVRRKGYGSDYERGWGDRQSVARDYIRQDRVLLGSMRTGPDLMNVGERPYTADWRHKHLYNPRIVSKGSTMPPFPFLYEKRELEDGQAPSPDALSLPPEHAPEKGFEIVPTRRAEALVAYLMSLRLDYDLPEAKRTVDE